MKHHAITIEYEPKDNIVVVKCWCGWAWGDVNGMTLVEIDAIASGAKRPGGTHDVTADRHVRR